jgi:hypothetical protein
MSTSTKDLSIPIFPHSTSANDIIQQLQPVVIPRISNVSHIALCERAAYNIDFLGMKSGDFSASGEIGNALHRVVIKSTLEIIDSLRKAKGSSSSMSKLEAVDLFHTNAIDDVDVNWKRFVLAGIEKPLVAIMEDLNMRANRLVNQLLVGQKDDRYQSVIFRPEFTIRNLQIPLEGRLDLVKIKIAKTLSESDNDADEKKNNKKGIYVASDDLAHSKIEDVEIIQIKTGRARPRNARWNLQADAEALLLMKALDLQGPPRYTWQFADKDARRQKFNFAKVHDAVDKYIRLWKSEVSPAITGYCQRCPLQEGCLGWSFASSSRLTQEDLARRRAEFNLSKRIREEISYVDRWKVYVSSRNPLERQQEGSAITNLKIDANSINLESQEVELVFDEGNDDDDKCNCADYNDSSTGSQHPHHYEQQQYPHFANNFIDFSVGEYVTISDGNPNFGSNPTATITQIDLEKRSIKLQLYRNDMYFLLYEDRQHLPLTIDRFGFSGLNTIKYLDGFFRDSPYADLVLQRSGIVSPWGSCNDC